MKYALIILLTLLTSCSAIKGALTPEAKDKINSKIDSIMDDLKEIKEDLAKLKAAEEIIKE